MSAPTMSALAYEPGEIASSRMMELVAYGTTAAFLVAAMMSFGLLQRKPLLPLLNAPSSRFSVEYRTLYQRGMKSIMDKARSLYPGQAYRVATDNGEVIILPYTFAEEIRDNPVLNFPDFMKKELQDGIPGFEVLSTSHGVDHTWLSRAVVQGPLSRSLNTITKPLSQETAYALSLMPGDCEDWQEFNSKEVILSLVARMSSRIFLGHPICRDEAWLRITTLYAVQLFRTAGVLRRFPKLLRPVVHWFVPECRELRNILAEAKSIVTPVVEERARLRSIAKDEGKPIPRMNDAIDWAEETSRKAGLDHDPASIQLALSTAAIHTTSNLMQQIFIDIASHPDMKQPIREEIVEQLKTHGWTKTALYNMKLLDSVIKETQRLTPPNLVSMRRYVNADMKLSNGLVLRKGSRVAVDAARMWDEDLHESPFTWQGNRFLQQRSQPGKENMAQAASVHPDHTAFGYGRHACPGRFFAVNEVKIAMCHLMVKYEWKLVPGTDVDPTYLGHSISPNIAAKILIRKRKDIELDIDALSINN